MSQQPKVKAPKSLSAPHNEHALMFSTLFLSYQNQPTRARTYAYLVQQYGAQQAPHIEYNLSAAFAIMKYNALLAMKQQKDGEEIHLGPGQRHLHPDLFNDLGFNMLYADQIFLKSIENRDTGSYGAYLESYIKDCQEHETQVSTAYILTHYHREGILQQ